jgi:hypothetical protein
MLSYEVSDELRDEFNRNGIAVIPGFYDVEIEILPIQKAIYEIIGLVMARHGLETRRQPFTPNGFYAGYRELIAANRAYGGEVYDLVKQIPAFLRLISSVRGESLFRQLRDTDLPGIGAASYGIRIDNPGEDRFRSHWHQEYLFQPQSIDGMVMWTPLLSIEESMGPVIACVGSHKDGLQKYSRSAAYSDKSGAYTIGMVDDEKVAARYPRAATLTNPGDLIVMDYLTIHQSGFNTSDKSRWSVQSRFFNYRHPSGAKVGWKASITAGTDVEEIFADYFVKDVA